MCFSCNGLAAQRSEILMIGDQDDYVEALQRRLKELGFFDTAPTGYFGAKTQQAVADYQSSAGLQAEGKTGL